MRSTLRGRAAIFLPHGHFQNSSPPGPSKRRTWAACRLRVKRGTMDDDKQRSRLGDEPATTDAGAPESGSNALVEPPEEAVARLDAQHAALQDRYLRLAAEYDNLRNPTLNELA